MQTAVKESSSRRLFGLARAHGGVCSFLVEVEGGGGRGYQDGGVWEVENGSFVDNGDCSHKRKFLNRYW
jgi:hypothetical protein